MRILVVGSSGYIGSRLVADLRNQACDVSLCSSRDGTGINPDTGLLPTDFCIEPGTDAVVYLACSPLSRMGSQGIGHIFAVNVQSAMVCAEAARRAGVRRYIYASTGNVYAPSFEPLSEMSSVRRDDWYALSKLHAEEGLALFRNSMDVIVTRLFGIYGPRQEGKLIPNLIRAVLNGQPIRLLGCPANAAHAQGFRLSVSFIDDVIGILTQLIVKGGPGCLNVAGPDVLSIRKIAEAVGTAANKVPVFDIPGVDGPSDLIANIELLRRELSPLFTPFPEGLARTIAEHCCPFPR